MSGKRIADFGYSVGTQPKGPLNKITDVPGVKVGHSTVKGGDHCTGATVIIPADGNLFANKLTAASYVHNGFGKTCGLPQIDELGQLETPIALTNTLNVGLVSDALIQLTLERCKEDHVEVYSVNPVVGECNDCKLNKIADRAVREEHVRAAFENACTDFEEGAVGAGAGTSCYGLKGGIGSASRTFEIDGKTYTLGVLVQSNFGATADLMICGEPVGTKVAPMLEARKAEVEACDKGSIIMIVATDAPVSDRQLKRIIRRCGVGLARTGSFLGHGSGEIMIGFTTANRIPKEPAVREMSVISEDLMNLPFRATVEATEEAVLNSMAAAETTTGYLGTTVYALGEFI